jgi:hypothetical protein
MFFAKKRTMYKYMTHNLMQKFLKWKWHKTQNHTSQRCVHTHTQVVEFTYNVYFAALCM